ncbi:hypothetical protein RUND412_009270 [Rhizina undulata]
MGVWQSKFFHGNCDVLGSEIKVNEVFHKFGSAGFPSAGVELDLRYYDEGDQTAIASSEGNSVRWRAVRDRIRSSRGKDRAEVTVRERERERVEAGERVAIKEMGAERNVSVGGVNVEMEGAAREWEKGPITHIVCFQYRNDIPYEEMVRHFESFLALKEKCVKPDGGRYLKSMKAGKNISKENFSRGMTHGFVLEFECQADLDYYINKDPVHVAFAKEAAPLLANTLVVDITDGYLGGLEKDIGIPQPKSKL